MPSTNTQLSASDAAGLALSAYGHDAPPAGWSLAATFSGSSTAVCVFVNNTTGMVVESFRGTANVPNGISDVADGGGSAWLDISGGQIGVVGGAVAAAHDFITANYGGYSVASVGDSLGGGFAQANGLLYGTPVYSFESAPIPATAQNDITAQFGTLDAAVNQWAAAGNQYATLYQQGDPATAAFTSGTLGSNGPGTASFYLPASSTTVMTNSWAQVEEASLYAAAALKDIDPVMSAFYSAQAATAAFNSHWIVNTVKEINSGDTYTTTVTSDPLGFSSPDVKLLVNALTDATFIDTGPDNQLVSVSEPNGSATQVAIVSTSTDSIEYSASASGGQTALIQAVVGGSGATYDDLNTGITNVIELGNINNIFDVSSGSVLLSDSAKATVDGSGDAILTGANAVLSLNGSNNSVSGVDNATGDTVDMLGGTGNTLSIDNLLVDVLGNVTNFSDAGANGLIDLAPGVSSSIYANGAEVDEGSNDYVNVYGDNNTVYGSDFDATGISGTTVSVWINSSDVTTFAGTHTGDFAAPVDGATDGTTHWESLWPDGSYGGDITNGGTSGTVPRFYYPSDPLILNLRGGPVRTVGLHGSHAYFDVRSDGQQIHTGWTTVGEGFLVMDPDNLPVTDEKQFIGGFGDLQALDANGDGVINAADASWKDLRVWVDSSGTGQFSASDLFTLDQLDITSISLGMEYLNKSDRGNTIIAESTFTFSDGSTGSVAGVYLASGAGGDGLARRFLEYQASFSPPHSAVSQFSAPQEIRFDRVLAYSR